MSDQYTMALVSGSLGIIVMFVAWAGNRFVNRMDAISNQMTVTMQTLQKQITDGDQVLHDRVTGLDRRVVRIEATCELHNRTHPGFMAHNAGD